MKGKDKIINVRLADEDKKKIAAAASQLGESTTNFVTQAALDEAQKVLSKKEREMKTAIKRTAHGGIPTFFKALCWTASHGGEHSYEDVGYRFAAATEGEQPYDAENDQWYEMLLEIRTQIENGNREGIWSWYREIFPRAMKLVPSRRKDAFVDGVLKAYSEGQLWFI